MSVLQKSTAVEQLALGQTISDKKIVLQKYTAIEPLALGQTISDKNTCYEINGFLISKLLKSLYFLTDWEASYKIVIRFQIKNRSCINCFAISMSELVVKLFYHGRLES